MEKKILTTADVTRIRQIADDLVRDKYTTLKEVAINEYLNDHPNKAEYRLAGDPANRDMIAHAWANAVVLFLTVKGYEIKKKE